MINRGMDSPSTNSLIHKSIHRFKEERGGASWQETESKGKLINRIFTTTVYKTKETYTRRWREKQRKKERDKERERAREGEE